MTGKITHVIDGEDVDSLDGATFDDVDPWTREPWATVALGGAADADRAVTAARRAFDEGPWPRMGFAERGALIHRLADLIGEHADELALADTRDMGKPIADALGKDVPRTAQNFRFFADHARLATAQTLPMDTGHHAYTRYEPAGVVAAIAPWNFPLMLESWKVAPALAWGNTVVLKPAEDSPASATILARLARDAGIPPGVLNVLHGYGPDSAGAALTGDPRVDRITFTGESGTGRVITGAAARNLTPVSLELGGKGANLVFADADLDNAVDWSIKAVFTNAGQICLAGSRLYVERPILDEFLARFVAAAEKLVLGDPKDPATQLGPLASETHYAKVRGYVEAIEAQGGKMLTGGLDDGWTIRPTVVVDAPEDAPDLPRGGLRPGRHRRAVRLRGGGGARGQRLAVRAQRDDLHREPVAGPPGGRGAAGGHDLDQLLLRPRPARPLRRVRRLGLGSGGRRLQPRVLHRAQGRGDGDPAVAEGLGARP